MPKYISVNSPNDHDIHQHDIDHLPKCPLLLTFNPDKYNVLKRTRLWFMTMSCRI